MDIPKDIKSQVETLLEDDLREKICRPLLKALGGHCVEKHHGRREKGKDIYFSYSSIFNEYKHCCLFIKAGDIKKSGSNNNDVRIIKGQIEEAIISSFVNPLNSSDKVYIEEIYILCNGKIKEDAREFLSDLFHSRSFLNFKVIDIDKLVLLIKGLIHENSPHIDKVYIFQIETFEDFCDKVLALKERENLNPKIENMSMTEAK